MSITSVIGGLQTPSTTRTLSERFRDSVSANAPTSRLDRWAAKKNARSRERGYMRGSARYGDVPNELRFWTPDGGSPSSQFEREPDFSVVGSVPHKSGLPSVIQMDVFDDGEERTVELESFYIEKFGETGANRRRADELLDSVRAALEQA